MVFFASFATALSAAYLYSKSEKTNPTLAIACVPIELISVLLVLVSAPWPLQLALVIAALLSYQMVRVSSVSGS